MELLSDFFLLCGVSLFCLGSAMTFQKIKFYRNSKITNGKVVDYERHERKHSCFHPIIEFNASKNNKIIFKSAVASNDKKYRIGEQVSIRYLTVNPQIAEINKTWTIWFDIPLCFIFCFVLLWVAFKFQS
jgi:hypothetical protein